MTPEQAAQIALELQEKINTTGRAWRQACLVDPDIRNTMDAQAKDAAFSDQARLLTAYEEAKTAMLAAAPALLAVLPDEGGFYDPLARARRLVELHVEITG